MTRQLTVSCLLSLLVTGLASPASAANTWNLNYFGQHMHRLVVHGAAGPTVFPPVRSDGGPVVGILRTWDSGTGTWAIVEPTQGSYYWDSLDLFVSTALQNGAEVLHTFGGMTPTWASARPTEWCAYGIPGCAAEPTSMDDYTRYLTALFTRYRGQIRYYEVWNEPSFAGTTPAFYTGSAATLWDLHTTAYALLKAIDPGATLLSPGFVGDPEDAFADYLDVVGDSFRANTDMVAFHYYGADPESILVRHVRLLGVLARHGLETMPVINTESGFQTADNLATPGAGLDPAIFPGWLARSYIWGMYAGLRRFLYYSYDGYSGLFSAKDTGTYNPAGLAQVQIGQWLQGATLGDCFYVSGAVYYCDVTRQSGGLAHIVWHAGDTPFDFPVPTYWEPVVEGEALDGSRVSVVGATTLALTGFPILVKGNTTDWHYRPGDAVLPAVHDPVRPCNLPFDYATEVLADAPVAYYKMTAPSGTTIVDASGLGHDATISGSLTAPAAVPGALYDNDDGALSFAAASLAEANGAQVPSSVNPWSGDFTIEFWANSATFANYQMAFSRETYLANGFRLAPQSSSFVSLWRLWTTESGGTVSMATSQNLATDAWNHIVLTYDHATNAFSFYVDGGFDTGESGGAYIPPTGGLSIGKGSGYYLMGALDEVAIYDKVLSADRIARHYQLGSNLCSPQAIARPRPSSAAPTAPQDLRIN